MLININEKKKLKLNMNLNKNNIKYYFSEYKMKQMIDNLQQNLENDEELRISIEKYRKDSKPHSAKNRLLSITGTNNSTNQSLKNEDKLTNNISDIDNTIKNQKTKSLECLSFQKENDNSFDSLNFNEKKIKKKNTFYQFFSKHSRLTNLYLPENNTAIEYIPFNKKNSNEVNSNKNNLKNNNLNTNNIYNNSNLNNPITFNNLTKNFINSSSIINSYNSYNKNINNTYSNFPIIRSKKSKLNKTQKLKLPEIHPKLSNKSCNDENIEQSVKSFDNKNKINLFFENNNNTTKIKEKKTSLYKNLRENNYSPIAKNKKNYKKQITLSYQKKEEV